jgi:hypothetical protein
MAIRRLSHAVFIGFGFLLAACAATPVYPLLTPIQVARDFGYFEQPIDDSHWVVSYVTPEAGAYGFRDDHAPAEAQVKNLALDMALWHASQIALAHGYAGFEVTDRRTSTDAVNSTDPYDDPYWYGGFGFRHRRFYGAWGGPGWYEPTRESTLQVEAKLTITLTKAPKGEDFRADETINRLRAIYPGADAAPPAPAPSPSTTGKAAT